MIKGILLAAGQSKRLKNDNKLLKKFKNHTLQSPNVIIVCGGDGFMLRAIQKFYRFSKPFFGINCGTIGFLMNQNINFDLKSKISIRKIMLFAKPSFPHLDYLYKKMYPKP